MVLGVAVNGLGNVFHNITPSSPIQSHNHVKMVVELPWTQKKYPLPSLAAYSDKTTVDTQCTCVYSAHLSLVKVLSLVLLSAWPLGSSTTTWGLSRKHQPLWTPMWSLLSCMTTALDAPSGPGCFWEWGALELWNYPRMTDHAGHLEDTNTKMQILE